MAQHVNHQSSRWREVHGSTWTDPSKPLTSRDVVNIEAMRYTYEVPDRLVMAPHPRPVVPILATGGVNRGAIAVSFVVSAWAVDEKMK